MATRQGPRLLLSTLAAAAVLPGLFGWRLIHAYATTPVVTVTSSTPANVAEHPGCAGAAVTADQTLLVSESARRRVTAFPRGASASFVFAPLPGEEQTGVGALAVGPRGNLFVLDPEAATLSLRTRDGQLVRLVSVSLAQPTAIAVDQDSRVYVAGAQGIARLGPLLEPDAAWGDAGSHVRGVAGIEGLAVLGSDLYASSGAEGALLRFGADGGRKAAYPLLGNAGPLAASADGARLFMGDAPTGRVWVLSPEGRTLARLAGPEDGPVLGDLKGLAVSSESALWAWNATGIQRFQLPDRFPPPHAADR